MGLARLKPLYPILMMTNHSRISKIIVILVLSLIMGMMIKRQRSKNFMKIVGLQHFRRDLSLSKKR